MYTGCTCSGEVGTSSGASRLDSCCKWTRDQLRWGATASAHKCLSAYIGTVIMVINVARPDPEVFLCRWLMALRAPARRVCGTTVCQVIQTKPTLRPHDPKPSYSEAPAAPSGLCPRRRSLEVSEVRNPFAMTQGESAARTGPRAAAVPKPVRTVCRHLSCSSSFECLKLVTPATVAGHSWRARSSCGPADRAPTRPGTVILQADSDQI
jgi:hypothetical protein